MRLIDADALSEALAIVAKKMAKSEAQKALMGRVLYILDNRHEEVVRCRECVGRPFWQKDDNGVPICLLSGLYVKSEDDFCSYGERKDGAE